MLASYAIFIHCCVTKELFPTQGFIRLIELYAQIRYFDNVDKCRDKYNDINNMGRNNIAWLI